MKTLSTLNLGLKLVLEILCQWLSSRVRYMLWLSLLLFSNLCIITGGIKGGTSIISAYWVPSSLPPNCMLLNQIRIYVSTRLFWDMMKSKDSMLSFSEVNNYRTWKITLHKKECLQLFFFKGNRMLCLRPRILESCCLSSNHSSASTLHHW